MPGAVQRLAIREADKVEDYMVVQDLRGLVALAQLGALELHTWTCRSDAVERPDQLVFDLDPDTGLSWERVVDAALTVRARLAELGLESFVKTTGGKGLHVVVPLRRGLAWDTHRDVAKAIATSIARAAPSRYVTNMRKDLRAGKIFLDYLRNGRGATAIAPYSTRAREGATVATPISWEELERGVDPRAFTVHSVMRRLSDLHADPWRDYPNTSQSLPAKALRALGVR